LERDGGAGDAVSLGKVGHPGRAAFTDDDADDVGPQAHGRIGGGVHAIKQELEHGAQAEGCHVELPESVVELSDDVILFRDHILDRRVAGDDGLVVLILSSGEIPMTVVDAGTVEALAACQVLGIEQAFVDEQAAVLGRKGTPPCRVLR